MTSNSGDKIIKKQVDTMQVSFDKEAAWLRLQDRMESRDERRRPMWMGWVAAAVLLLISVIWYSRSGTTQVVTAEPKTSITPVVVKQKLQVPVPENKSQAAAPKTNKTMAVHREQKEAAPQKIATPEPEVQPRPAVEAPVVVQEALKVPDVPAVVVVQKKKMKRVHINDLADDDREKQRMANQRIDEQYASGRKYGLIKPATEREDAEKNTYSLLGMTKTDVN